MRPYVYNVRRAGGERGGRQVGEGQCFIDGAWRAPRQGDDDGDDAAAAAARAWPAWRLTPPRDRAALVARAARLIEARADQIAAALVRDRGKLPAEARAEVARAVALVDRAAAYGAAGGQALAPTAGATLGYVRREPRGVALVTFLQWDLALAPAVGLAAALVTGNTAVVSPDVHDATPALVVRCFTDAGAPAGAVNLVQISRRLARHPSVAAVWDATYSAHRLGEAVDLGAAVLEERGGVGAALVLEDADLDLAVAGVMAATYRSAWQPRGAVDQLILAHPVADAFLEQLVAAVAALRLGADERAQLGPLPSELALREALARIAAAREAGADLLHGGARAGGELAQGWFLTPAVLDYGRSASAASQRRVAGPALAAVRVEGFEEALAAVGLERLAVAQIYTRDAARAFRFTEAVNAAQVLVNAREPADLSPDLDALLAHMSAPKAVRLEY